MSLTIIARSRLFIPTLYLFTGIIFFAVAFFAYGAKFFLENFIYAWALQVGIMIDMSTPPPFATFPSQWMKHGALLRKGMSENIKVFFFSVLLSLKKCYQFTKTYLFSLWRKWRIDWNVSTCENVKLLCLEFMLESAAEQHGLILWILVVMFFFL